MWLFCKLQGVPMLVRITLARNSTDMETKKSLSELLSLDRFDVVALIGEMLMQINNFTVEGGPLGIEKLEAGFRETWDRGEAMIRVKSLLEIANILWACNKRLEAKMTNDEQLALTKVRKMVDMMLMSVDAAIRDAFEKDEGAAKDGCDGDNNV